jgi:ferric-dicitrate binding protein FerR (iron transport regulator)
MNAPGHKLPVEPLSRPAWDRVESRLMASLARGEHLAPASQAPPRRIRAGVQGAFAALAIAAAGLLWFNSPFHHATQEPRAETAALAPPSASEPTTPASVDGSRIVTTTGPVQTSIGDSELVIADHSALRVHGDDQRGWLLSLESGQVACHVAPRRGRAPFVVEAGDTRVTVVGTRFVVTREADGARVGVEEGIVRVDSRGQSVQLLPGDSWPHDAAEPAVTPPEPEPKQHARSKASRARATTGASAAQRRFEQATRLEATDPEAALRLYRDLSHREPWAQNALYAQARLEVELGRPSAGRDLNGYLKRYPNGPNAADVKALLRNLSARSTRP